MTGLSKGDKNIQIKNMKNE